MELKNEKENLTTFSSSNQKGQESSKIIDDL